MKKKLKLTTAQAKGLLPKTVRMKYDVRDVLDIALRLDSDEHEIDCVDAPDSNGDFVVVYKLVRVERLF